MRPLLVLLLLALPAQAADLQGAEAWLLDEPASVAGLEALHALQVDTLRTGHLSQLEIPPDDADDPTVAARALHALAMSGYAGSGALGAPQVDLASRLAARAPGVLEQARGATMAFHLLTVHAAGLDPSAVDLAIASQLASLQDGGFPCNATDVGLDCTGFAIAALGALGQPFDAAAALAYVRGHDDGTGAFATSAESQAWALIALRWLGGVDRPALEYLDTFQAADGRFLHKHDGSGSDVLATRDAVLAFTGFPGPRTQPVSWHATSVDAGLWLHADGDDVTWTVVGPSGTKIWDQPDIVLADAVNVRAYVHVRDGDAHGRAMYVGPMEHADPGAPGLGLGIVAAALLVLVQRAKRV